MPYFPKVVKVKVKIVDGIQHGGRDFGALVEVAEVGPAEIPAGGAGAVFVERALIGRIFPVLDGYRASGGEERPVSGVPGGEDAVEKVDAPLDGFENVLNIPMPIR